MDDVPSNKKPKPHQMPPLRSLLLVTLSPFFFNAQEEEGKWPSAHKKKTPHMQSNVALGLLDLPRTGWY